MLFCVYAPQVLDVRIVSVTYNPTSSIASTRGWCFGFFRWLAGVGLRS